MRDEIEKDDPLKELITPQVADRVLNKLKTNLPEIGGNILTGTTLNLGPRQECIRRHARSGVVEITFSITDRDRSIATIQTVVGNRLFNSWQKQGICIRDEGIYFTVVLSEAEFIRLATEEQEAKTALNPAIAAIRDGVRPDTK